MKLPNLSAWALEHKQFIAFLIVMLSVAGALSYFSLGRAEDPGFTFKVMVVRTLWPGATAPEVERELTERIEKKLQETPWVDVLRSSSKPGESLVFVVLKDFTPKNEVPESWRQVRKKLDDIRHTLPEGVQGPFPNDEFGDVQINIFALTGDGHDLAALRRHADRIALELRRVHEVKRVELIGVQDEKIFVDVDPQRMVMLGITPLQVADALQKQNAVSPAGFIETDSDRIRLRVSGGFDSVQRVRNTDLLANGKHFRLGDIARVSRGLADPPGPQMRLGGQPAIGVGVVMDKGGDVIALGEHLKREVQRLGAELPAGMEVHVVADQPEVVRGSIHLFQSSLAEAVLIVLAVSFLSLGWRTGTVVALSIPLVLAITFFAMKLFGIDLQRISLGALVIALGLLVDDAIIAVEMMVVKMEQGWDKFKAATFAYTSTAFPMLTGTLITAAAFTPVGFSKSAASEYTVSIFQVVAIALLTSWVVAVVFTPYIGYKLLDPEKLAGKAQKHGADIYDTPFYRRFRALVTGCLRHRWKVIFATALIFLLSIWAFGKFVQQQFFPSASRLELMVDVLLPQGASIRATTREVQRIEKLLGDDPAVAYSSSYIGNGAPRYFLSLDQQLFADNFGQFVIVTRDMAAREDLKSRLEQRFAAPDFAAIRVRVVRLENGPPIGYPVQFRVMGDDLAQLREQAAAVAALMRANPHLQNINLDWNEKVKSVRAEVDQDRARQLGTSTREIAQILQAWLNGIALTQYREGDQLIDVVWRGGQAAEAQSLNALPDLEVPLAGGGHVPLAQVARLVPVLEEGVIWRRNRVPTMTVRADMADSTQPATVSAALNAQLDTLRAGLPAGFRIEMGGSIEESDKNGTAIAAVMPLMLVGVVTLLMIQLQNISRTVIVLLTAPLGLIGVVLALLVFQVPFGFVANLGFIALAGMIMRNAVILVDQIRQDEEAGKSQWEAIIGSTVRRFRPIVLTASAAILAMIPLTRQVFWGPMAVSIMGGLIVATLLTCLFLPALYAAWYRVREESAA
ncbi:MAG: efflux RND transporter permease subunit [Gallionella sp.]|nr:efflux RND transporter permease subunit [Gallionella sp.]NCP80140.1 efflux RND transporter permease subunit [Gallionella sp.]OIO12850.1 MAG: multidrug transporter AcrB [Gallionellaceae bacterium CG1_02_60_325]PIV48115.1 MAG: multidrug transporter AcrB [Gallionellaceae bacterium CG02_land_8_20_14_3_00_60_115]PJC04303.1 MAG: multidrug transporter AcrB [Gallionellaceae bacterium CG_4_9_14_0_8_um_filter_60_335]